MSILKDFIEVLNNKKILKEDLDNLTELNCFLYFLSSDEPDKNFPYDAEAIKTFISTFNSYRFWRSFNVQLNQIEKFGDEKVIKTPLEAIVNNPNQNNLFSSWSSTFINQENAAASVVNMLYIKLIDNDKFEYTLMPNKLYSIGDRFGKIAATIDNKVLVDELRNEFPLNLILKNNEDELKKLFKSIQLYLSTNYSDKYKRIIKKYSSKKPIIK